MVPQAQTVAGVTITATEDAVSAALDKKTFTVAENISQLGGSVLQAMSTVPGVTVGQEGKVELRGSDKVLVLIDGKQTALTGFGSQNGLDNLPASALERIEVITNPSAKFDANASAGIINLVFRKQEQEGFSGKVGVMGGAGALWVKKENCRDSPAVSGHAEAQSVALPQLPQGRDEHVRAGRLAPFANAEQERILHPQLRLGTVIIQQIKRIETPICHAELRRRPRLR